MLIGVLCEVVAAVSESEHEKNVVNFAKTQFLEVIELIDLDHSATITEEEFAAFCMHEAVQAPLAALEVDRENLMALKDVLFAVNKHREVDNSVTPTALRGQSTKSLRDKLRASQNKKATRELPYSELMEKILDLRASNDVKVSHIVDLRKYIRSNQKKTQQFLLELHSDIEEAKEEQRKKTEEVIAELRQDIRQMKALQTELHEVHDEQHTDRLELRSELAEMKQQLHQIMAHLGIVPKVTAAPGDSCMTCA
eukprot:gnl/MRDRNA2_/MRDRNA2_69965_c0_seq1.p1 gnl/MRDRNA2_/MRDRNA2_69965_c0~~gnl/MRDRNA2_/MRDRNA2_69965_c0_seq1.p1  ORF type:complete len:253 (-),score=66.47 gnl/MRDRNA2_/MRDRNA2_69965_c0_seq1:16-774(-)